MDNTCNIQGIYFINNIYHEKISAKPKYILDSNIIVKMEKLFYSPDTMRNNDKDQIIELLLYLKQKSFNIDFNYALTELSTDYQNGGVISKRYYYTRRAITNLISMSEKKLQKHAKYSKGKASHSNTSEKQNFGNLSTVISKTLPSLSISFLPLLKFYSLVEIHGISNRVKIFYEWTDFIAENMKMMPLYELAAITHFLFGDESEFNNAQSLMKVNKKIDLISKSWNVSWDLSFLRYINEISARQLSNELPNDKNLILVTSDNALSKISELLIFNDSINFEGKYVSNIVFEIEKINKKYQENYIKVYNRLMNDEAFSQRVTKVQSSNPIDTINKFLILTDNFINTL